MKRVLALALCLVLSFACAVPAFAGDKAEGGTLRIIDLNVDGLPIPAWASSENRDPLACSRKLPAWLNEYNADIIAVQEDFNFHAIHKKGIDLPYKTMHSGPIPFGDGLNFFSRFPIYNVAREAWNDAYGVLDSSGDQLTPKGFLCASMEIVPGVVIDVYDFHADADDGDGDIAARVSEFRQMLKFVDTYSKDHAVILVGDTNARFLQTQSELKKQFIDEAGFKEIWIELENEGRYELTDDDVARFKSRYGNGSWWGVWDSAEKMFYRDGGGVSFEALSHEYIWLYDEDGSVLADHAMEIGELRYSIDRSAVNDTRTYKTESFNLFHTLYWYTKYFFKSLFLLLGALPGFIRSRVKKA